MTTYATALRFIKCTACGRQAKRKELVDWLAGCRVVAGANQIQHLLCENEVMPRDAGLVWLPASALLSNWTKDVPDDDTAARRRRIADLDGQAREIARATATASRIASAGWQRDLAQRREAAEQRLRDVAAALLAGIQREPGRGAQDLCAELGESLGLTAGAKRLAWHQQLHTMADRGEVHTHKIRNGRRSLVTYWPSADVCDHCRAVPKPIGAERYDDDSDGSENLSAPASAAS
jgi:hypothetical protein